MLLFERLIEGISERAGDGIARGVLSAALTAVLSEDSDTAVDMLDRMSPCDLKKNLLSSRVPIRSIGDAAGLLTLITSNEMDKKITSLSVTLTLLQRVHMEATADQLFSKVDVCGSDGDSGSAGESATKEEERSHDQVILTTLVLTDGDLTQIEHDMKPFTPAFTCKYEK